jgi:hypothetical protein
LEFLDTGVAHLLATVTPARFSNRRSIKFGPAYVAVKSHFMAIKAFLAIVAWHVFHPAKVELIVDVSNRD